MMFRYNVDAIEVKQSGFGNNKTAIGFKAKLSRQDPEDPNVTYYASMDLPYESGFPLPNTEVELEITWQHEGHGDPDVR